MIPDYISREHVLEAMARIDREGVPAGRSALKFAVSYEQRRYPPKLLISLAHEVATGRPLPSVVFSGGMETNSFLQGLGFTVRSLDGSEVATRVREHRDGGVRLEVRPRNLVDVETVQRQLTGERTLCSWRDLARSRELPPRAGGIYAWFFKEAPSLIPTEGCVQRDGMTLLYVGISPHSAESGASLRSRIRFHYRGNAEGSTLRLSLGCVLEKELGTGLRRVGSGKRRTFGFREAALSLWMESNAVVTWVETDEPWLVEGGLISALPLPLNIEMNAVHPFCASLRQLRLEARQRADRLPILRGH